MPELPEVETLRRSLLRRLPGREIQRTEVRSPALREPLDSRALKALEGMIVRDLGRRAKYLLIELSEATGATTKVDNAPRLGRLDCRVCSAVADVARPGAALRRHSALEGVRDKATPSIANRHIESVVALRFCAGACDAGVRHEGTPRA